MICKLSWSKDQYICSLCEEYCSLKRHTLWNGTSTYENYMDEDEGATKNAKKIIIRFFIKKMMIRSIILNNLARHVIDYISCS
jgi:hypothetical protein